MEFGSDFHYVSDFNGNSETLHTIYPSAIYFADGRQCIISLIKEFDFQRIWIPEYFCYEVIESLKRLSDVKICFYKDNPLNTEFDRNITELPFSEKDVFLRVTYFGLRKNELHIPIPIIEDHSHDIINPTALNSNADWCIASLRKTLPIAEGGILWSPKELQLYGHPGESELNNRIAKQRWDAMSLKANYLTDNNSVEKDSFRRLFLSTEEEFNFLQPCKIDDFTDSYLSKFDITGWQKRKFKNLEILNTIVDTQHKGIAKINNRFSFLLLCKDQEQRNNLRMRLIQHNIYPAILWNVPDNVSFESKKISNCILSIHCDGRYSKQEIYMLGENINNIIRSI